MDTVKTAILVDYDLWESDEWTRFWIGNHRENAYAVLLVKNPETANYDPADTRWKNYEQFDVVITNSGGKPDEEFKENALNVLMTTSNLTPVVALDGNWEVLDTFDVMGVLVNKTGAKGLMVE